MNQIGQLDPSHPLYIKARQQQAMAPKPQIGNYSPYGSAPSNSPAPPPASFDRGDYARNPNLGTPPNVSRLEGQAHDQAAQSGMARWNANDGYHHAAQQRIAAMPPPVPMAPFTGARPAVAASAGQRPTPGTMTGIASTAPPAQLHGAGGGGMGPTGLRQAIGAQAMGRFGNQPPPPTPMIPGVGQPHDYSREVAMRQNRRLAGGAAYQRDMGFGQPSFQAGVQQASPYNAGIPQRPNQFAGSGAAFDPAIQAAQQGGRHDEAARFMAMQDRSNNYGPANAYMFGQEMLGMESERKATEAKAAGFGIENDFNRQLTRLGPIGKAYLDNPNIKPELVSAAMAMQNAIFAAQNGGQPGVRQAPQPGVQVAPQPGAAPQNAIQATATMAASGISPDEFAPAGSPQEYLDIAKNKGYAGQPSLDESLRAQMRAKFGQQETERSFAPPQPGASNGWLDQLLHPSRWFAGSNYNTPANHAAAKWYNPAYRQPAPRPNTEIATQRHFGL
jgi:hypothetical protein